MIRGFGSDNHSGVHPEILKSISTVNEGHAPSYGTDEVTQRATLLFKDVFGPQAEVFFVFNGTAANVLCLRALSQSTQSVFCSDVAHIHVDECAAPEYMAHVKLLPLKTENGKISVEDLERNFIRRGDQHYSQTQVVSLTQPTELGTVYSLSELKQIINWAKSHGLFVHMDGARLANASYTMGLDFKSFTTDIGVDMVSFGGTKNGLLGGEAVICLNQGVAKELKYMRKQMAQLPSKTRFISAQFESYLRGRDDGQPLWHKIAEHSCQMAQLLKENVSGIAGVEITRLVESNGVFARIPKSWVKPLREKYFFYVWDENTVECRWMTSWDTQIEDVMGFSKALKALCQESK